MTVHAPPADDVPPPAGVEVPGVLRDATLQRLSDVGQVAHAARVGDVDVGCLAQARSVRLHGQATHWVLDGWSLLPAPVLPRPA